MPDIRVDLPSAQLKEYTVGSIVVVEVRGRVTELGEGFDNDEGGYARVEGEASIRPGSMTDAARMAFTKLANDKGPKDFPTGQRELHAP